MKVLEEWVDVFISIIINHLHPAHDGSDNGDDGNGATGNGDDDFGGGTVGAGVGSGGFDGVRVVASCGEVAAGILKHVNKF